MVTKIVQFYLVLNFSQDFITIQIQKIFNQNVSFQLIDLMLNICRKVQLACAPTNGLVNKIQMLTPLALRVCGEIKGRACVHSFWLAKPLGTCYKKGWFGIPTGFSAVKDPQYRVCIAINYCTK